MNITLRNWGNYPAIAADELLLERTSPTLPQQPGWIPRGLGRSYGDSATANQVVNSLLCNRFLAFDPQTGVMTAEGGVSYDDLLQVCLPHGWFPPVTPGTKFVTMGGAFASDVHGKNHHGEGSFANHTLAIDLLLPQGEMVHCSPSENAHLFWATAGGMGLTGVILSVTLQLKRVTSAFIQQKALKYSNLSEVFAGFGSHPEYTYSVAWIDTVASGKGLGRSILLLGEHCDDPRGFESHPNPKLDIPLDFPPGILNRLTISAFNFLYYNKMMSREKNGVLHYNPYFYPLDAINRWNRIYGKKGFTQYQFVVPHQDAQQVVAEVLHTCRKAGFGSFLSVLKTMGAANDGWLSFPMEGVTLTLDFPISQRLFPLLDRLDEIVLAAGGRLYLTKDVRLNAASFRKMYPRAGEFSALLDEINPGRRVYSRQAARLEL